MRLMQVANDDQNIRQSLLQILTQTPDRRRAALDGLISRSAGAPQEFMSALLLLKDDQIADRALALLSAPRK